MRMRLSTSANTVGLTKFPLRAAPVSSGGIEAAAQQRRALLRTQFDVAAHLGEVRGADHRSDDGLLVERIADADAPRALDELSANSA